MGTMKEVRGQSPLRHARQEAVVVRGIFTIATGTGGVSASDVDTPDLTLTRTGVGLYTLAYPSSPDDVAPLFSLVHGGTPNIFTIIVLTNSPTTGVLTFSIGTFAAPYTPVDNTETGLSIYITLIGDTGL